MTSDDAVRQFADLYPFGLDEYQLEGCRELTEGRGVLVAAPTGAGKTVVGEFAVFLAVENSRKCFYTTPIKALSNQKYHDLVARHGVSRVGLLTGDASINGEAPVVVMTTEVLRNMMYAASPTLGNLGFVVMDEVHYLADRFRGPVWEEVILGLAESVQIVALSATVSNAEEFGEWLRTVRGEFSIVVSERRPVPLFQHVLVGRKLVDLFEGVAPTAQELPAARIAKVNRELLRVSKGEAGTVRDDARRPRGRSGKGKRDAGGQYGDAAHSRFKQRPTSRGEVAIVLDRAELLPAIYFIFSRVGCDSAVRQVYDAGITLTSRSEARLLGEIADKHVLGLSAADLDALKFEDFRDALMAGVAAHHAGQLPAFKAIVEEGFASGALKIVFATETLALGINMPARTVVLEKLVKYNGESHVDITPGEYTQLTGRAGRRGIDVEGHAVVLWQSGMDPRAVAGLASRRTYPLKSSFKPTYNMAVNLLATLGRARARDLLNQSFAQFQADKSVVRAARVGRQLQADLEAATEAVECHLGDFMEYARLRDEISRLEAETSKARKAERAEELGRSITTLMVGDVVHVPRQGWSVVLGVGQKQRRGDEPWAQIISGDHTVMRLQPHDLPGPLVPVGRVRVPRDFSVRDRRDRRSVLAAMSAKIEQIDPDIPTSEPVTDDSVAREVRRLRGELASHPCHDCPDREVHAVEAARFIRIERESRRTEEEVTGRANCSPCSSTACWPSSTNWATSTGRASPMPAACFGASTTSATSSPPNASAATCSPGLTPPQLAAVLSTLLYETRPTRNALPPRMPDADSERAQSELRAIWREVGQLERKHKRDRGREPDIGFAEAAWRWASGQDLAKVLATSDMSAGDFVRWVRQVIDLAGQLATASGPGDLRRTCHQAADAMRRGVVAADMAED